MIQIIGNNIQQLINTKVAASKDPDSTRAKTIEELQKLIKPNRLSGLLKGTYSISRDEIWIVKWYFKLKTADEVVQVHTLTENKEE